MTVGKLLNSGGLAALAAGLALIALPASASAQERGQWRGGGDGAASVQRGGGGGGNWGGNNGNGRGSRWNGASSQGGGGPASAPQTSSSPSSTGPSSTSQAQVRGNWRGGVDRSSPALRQEQAAQSAQGRPQRWSSQSGGTVNSGTPGRDGNRNPAWSGGDRDGRNGRDGRDGRWDGNRDRADHTRNDNARNDNDRWRDNNNRRGNDRWRDNDGRRDNERWRDSNNRWGHNDSRNWNRQWRNDNRYNWQGWRSSNRHTYRLGSYYAPYRGYSYRRLGIGFRLDSLFFGSRYLINDPWDYRLPAAYGPYRWVRYYDDVVLVDIYSGEVVDVIYDFFW
ncbi:MAG: RcnB family protein [Novosphingobium sp.]|nr:RcnB family protein [Novosphingobium sp.]